MSFNSSFISDRVNLKSDRPRRAIVLLIRTPLTTKLMSVFNETFKKFNNFLKRLANAAIARKSNSHFTPCPD